LTQRALHPADLADDGRGSFGFYQVLPSDRPRLSADWPTINLRALGGRLSETDFEDYNESDLDALSLALLASAADGLPTEIDWQRLATGLSLLYANQLRPGGQRPRRMAAARANFYLRDCLDLERSEDAGLVDERRFDRPFVWDWQPLPEGELVVDSSEKNFSFPETGGGAASVRLGLPTQMDSVGNKRFSISSCYSDGWYEWTMGEVPIFHTHHRPVVLAFVFDSEQFGLDRDGIVWRFGDGKEVATIDIETVWRARIIGETLYVSDWGEPGVLTVIDAHTWRSRKVSCGPALLTNDVCRLGSRYYIICKMQGRVFSFDEDMNPLDSRMSFGKGRGRLYDPITIRPHQGNLCVLSWLTGALATVKPF